MSHHSHDHTDHDHPHPHPHNHDHDHDHAHPHPHDHDHPHPTGLWGWISTIFHLHGHSHQHQAVGGTWLNFPILDPIIGLLIGVAILFITRDALVAMWYRLMDAIEPEILAQAESVAQGQAEVKAVNRLRMRWIGHRLHAEVHIAVEPELTTAQSHDIAEQLRHALFHEIRNLSEVVVHVDPWSEKLEAAHHMTLHHEPVPEPIGAHL